jgi:hypothetical protein
VANARRDRAAAMGFVALLHGAYDDESIDAAVPFFSSALIFL